MVVGIYIGGMTYGVNINLGRVHIIKYNAKLERIRYKEERKVVRTRDETEKYDIYGRVHTTK